MEMCWFKGCKDCYYSRIVVQLTECEKEAAAKKRILVAKQAKMKAGKATTQQENRGDILRVIEHSMPSLL